MTDALLFAGLALIGAMPVFLLVASIKRCSLRQARLNTMTFLEDWGGIAPQRLANWFKLTFGSSVAFGLLIALAFAFNLVGDGTAPRISSAFGHFNVSYVEWSVSHEFDWKTLMTHLRTNWKKLHPSEDIEDPTVWAKWKNDRKKYQARGARTLVYFSILMFVAGFIDILGRRQWRRGVTVTILGALFFLMMIFVWAERKGHYVEAVLAANDSLGELMMPQPPSLLELEKTLPNKQIQPTP